MIRWLALLAVSVVFNALAILLAPVLVLFGAPAYGPISNGNSTAIEPRLPWWLSWFDTPDNSLWGDDGHKERWGNAGSYAQMVAWLWRNPAYGFERSVLGAHIDPAATPVVEGDPWIKNRVGAKAGTLHVRMPDFYVGEYWCWKRVTRPFWDGETCLMMEFGWKLQPYAQFPALAKIEPVAQFVFSIRLTAFLP